MRKEVEDAEESLKLQAIWDFEVKKLTNNVQNKKQKLKKLKTFHTHIQGYLKYSPIFYGYYSKTEMTSEGMLLACFKKKNVLLHLFPFYSHTHHSFIHSFTPTK